MSRGAIDPPPHFLPLRPHHPAAAFQVLQQDAELKALKTKMAAIEEIIKQAAEASQGGKRAVEQVIFLVHCFVEILF